MKKRRDSKLVFLLGLIYIVILLLISINLGIEYNTYVIEPRKFVSKADIVFDMCEKIFNDKDFETEYVKHISKSEFLHIREVAVSKNQVTTFYNISSNGEYTLIIDDKGNIKVKKGEILILESNKDNSSFEIIYDYFKIRIILLGVLIFLGILFILGIPSFGKK